MSKKESILSLFAITILICFCVTFYAKSCGYISAKTFTLMSSMFLLANATIWYCRIQLRSSVWTTGEKIIVSAFAITGIVKFIELFL